jgi:predicted membrane-bound spermidine synthase
VLFPALTPALVPAFRSLLPRSELLNTLRLLLAFGLMVVPATAMGVTLPVLVRACAAREQFGRALGLIYGANTLGAVAGALTSELFLIGAFGIRGSGLAAAGLDGLAALGAARLAGRWPAADAAPRLDAPEPPATGRGRCGWLLAASFLCGAILLALEVVWFRFLLLFAVASSLTFATMLAVVLLGIGLGGLSAVVLLRLRADADRFLPWLALGAGVATVHTYVAFADGGVGRTGAYLFAGWPILLAAARLMLPVSLVSGILFTLMGKAIREGSDEDARAAGRLTLTNTTGAMVGALLAGFVLLPGLGMERALFVLALGYAAAAVLAALAWDWRRVTAVERRALGAGALLLAAYLALFPFGLMRNHYIPVVAARWSGDGSRVVAVREGLTETIVYLRRDFLGEPTGFRLLTNGFSMSGTGQASLRYMKLYVYWPVAVHPDARRALLISFGVGATAQALVDTAGLEAIDVVDTSREILETSRIVFPPPATHPLDDPRVRLHVEDGRFFLMTTRRSYDIITAEPPPPKNAGIEALYSLEYFSLLRSRLAPGGVATYWLPVYQLHPPEALAIVRAFCDAFADCSLWSGWGQEWMLAGTHGATGSVSREAFERQWRDPRVAPTLRALGLEGPEHLGATFLADASTLRELTAAIRPLDDDHPRRLSQRPPGTAPQAFYRQLADPRAARERFVRSELVARLWPPAIRERTLAAFDDQQALDRYAAAAFGLSERPGMPDLHALLVRPSPRATALWLLGVSAAEERAARAAASRGSDDPLLHRILGAVALAERRFLDAEREFHLAQRRTAQAVEWLAQARVLALALAGDTPRARELLASADDWIEPTDRPTWDFLARLLGAPAPFPAPPRAAHDPPRRPAADVRGRRGAPG